MTTMTTKKAKSAKHVLVRSHLAGVFVGELVGEPSAERVELRAARRIYSWSGALSVDTIARIGCNSVSRLTGPQDVTVYGQIVQVCPLTEEARANLYAMPVAK